MSSFEAPNDEVAEEYLRAVRVTWPEYRDVVQRLEAIEARRSAREGDGDGGEGGG